MKCKPKYLTHSSTLHSSEFQSVIIRVFRIYYKQLDANIIFQTQYHECQWSYNANVYRFTNFLSMCMFRHLVQSQIKSDRCVAMLPLLLLNVIYQLNGEILSNPFRNHFEMISPTFFLSFESVNNLVYIYNFCAIDKFFFFLTENALV